MGERLYISMYHYVRDLSHSRYPGIKGLDCRLFREQLQFFRENFHVVSMEQVIGAVEGKQALPDRALLLTFDDGYMDHFTSAFPLLEEFGFQGSFFVSGKTVAKHQLLDVNKVHYILASAETKELLKDLHERIEHYRGGEFDYPPYEALYGEYAVANRWDCADLIFVKRMLQTVLPEKLRTILSSELFAKYVGISEEKLASELYMTREQIRTLKRHGMFIGVHGYDHYWLGRIENEKMYKDIDLALDVLEEFIDRERWVMNYPYGNCKEEVVAYVKKRGGVVGLTVEPDVADLCRHDPLMFPRLDCNDFPPKSENYLKFAKQNGG